MAEPRWLGAAVDIPQVDTVTVTDTWANPGDIGTLTINGKDLTLTVGTDSSTTEVALALKEMVNGDTQTGTGDHTFSQTGNNVGEFSRITATSSAAVLTLTADDAGVPFTLTTSETTGGDGTLVEATVTAATGKHFADNADNWSTGVPADADEIVADSGNVDIKYNLSMAIQPASVKVLPGYTGNIGLPKVNRDDLANPYDEYRGDYLVFDLDGVQSDTSYDLQGGGGRIKIDVGAGDTITFRIDSTVPRAETDVPAILLKGTAVDNTLDVIRGDVGVAFYDDEASDLSVVNVSFFDDLDGDARVILGDGCDLTNAAIVQQGGLLQIDSTTSGGTIKVLAGELTILSGAHADIEIDGGTVFYESTGTLTTVKVGSDGILDFRRNLNTRIVTNAEIHKGGAIQDPKQSVDWSANGIDVVRCSIRGGEECNLDIGTHFTLTPSAI